MEEVWKTVAAIVVSVGGTGAIIAAVVSFCANRIADRLEKKYENKLDKQLEEYKSELNSKEYITQVQFDKEFKSYADLLSKANAMVQYSFWLFPSCIDSVPQSEEEKRNIFVERYQKAVEAYNAFLTMHLETIPFIDDTISNRFQHLSDLCKLQINMTTICGALAPRRDKYVEEIDGEVGNCYLRTAQITKEHDDLLKSIHLYLNELKSKRIIKS